MQALRFLGVNPTEKQHQEMQDRLEVDDEGTVAYGGMSASYTEYSVQLSVGLLTANMLSSLLYMWSGQLLNRTKTAVQMTMMVL